MACLVRFSSSTNWISLFSPFSVSIPLTPTLSTFSSVSMAGRLMHAVQYHGYGGGPAGLKVIYFHSCSFFFFYNYHSFLLSGFFQTCYKFPHCWYFGLKNLNFYIKKIIAMLNVIETSNPRMVDLWRSHSYPTFGWLRPGWWWERQKNKENWITWSWILKGISFNLSECTIGLNLIRAHMLFTEFVICQIHSHFELFKILE